MVHNKMDRINKKTMLYMYMIAIVVFLLAIALTNITKAQTAVALGAKAGYSGSKLSGDDIGSIDLRETVSGGLFLQVSPVPYLSFQPEVLFRRKGAVNNNEAFNIREEYNLDYIETPLLLKLRVPIAKAIYPNVFGGPYFAFKTNSTYSATQTDTDVSLNRSFEAKKSDYGAVIGGGVDIELKPIYISVDARYGIGATEIENSDEPVDLKNRDFTLMAGIGILFGK